ncbi:MAG: DUF5106 domain-containing protein [Prolixibacteraceae bacterium]
MKLISQISLCSWKLIALIFLCFATASCHLPEKKNPAVVVVPVQTKAYQPPVIPLMLTTPEQKTVFLVEHFWNNFNFRDTSQLAASKPPEQAFANFITYAGQVSPEQAAGGIRKLLAQAEMNRKNTLLFLGLAEKYLYHPNSPMRNDQLYEIFLELACASKVLDDTYKYRFKKQYELALKNKPGNKASDFIFTLKNGSSSSLLRTKSKLLILYFFNPECNECKVARGKMIQSAVIGQLEKKGALQILSVYPDLELSAWTRNYAELPASWINGYDKGSVVQKKAIYDLKAIPTLYLLDENKTVLLRDATVENIETYLIQLTSLVPTEGAKTKGQK